jgi:hypothetical protein
MTTDASQNLWRFVRLDQYNRPSETSRETMRKGIFGLWRHLGWGSKAEESVFAEKELGQVPPGLLDKVVPTPDWSAPAGAVTAALDPWLDAKVPGSSAQIFVGPPYHGTPEILTAWAQARGWRLVSAPPPERILTEGDEWLTQLEADDEPLVLPHLEHCYLRHYNGLTLLRRLLDHIFSHSRRCLVGCDSWAWAYLSKAFKLDTVLPMPFILEAFDQERLKIWFQQLETKSGESNFVFRQSDSGKYVLPPATGEEAPGDRSQSSGMDNSGFLKNIAAYSLGIPGIAWAVWRRSLASVLTAEEDAEGSDRKAEPVEGGDHAYPIWVKPWSELNLPTVPRKLTSHPMLMVLHTLLIHGGLWSRVLPELVPLSPTEIMEHLYFLEAAELLQSDQGFWRVSPVGYPPLRQALSIEGYLTDGL